jgi:hypothetical protein
MELMDKIEKLGLIVFVMFLFSLVNYFFFINFIIKENNKRINAIISDHKWDVVDSVEIIGPGEINTLQFDNMYKVRTKNNHEFVSRQNYKKGDTVHYFFQKYGK